MLSSCFAPVKYDLDFSSAESLSTEEYNEIKSYVDTLRPEVDRFFSYPFAYHWDSKNVDKLCTVGINGIPVLCDTLVEAEENQDYWTEEVFPTAGCGWWLYREFIHEGIRGIARFNPILPFSRADCGTPKFIYILWTSAKSDIPERLASDESTEEKIHYIKRYGIFAIPFVRAQIESGNTEFEAFFTEIGLHVDDSEFLRLSEFNHMLADGYSTLRSSGNPEEFDYKAWLNENEDDLNALYKYMDEFCAEYEAKQKAE